MTRIVEHLLTFAAGVMMGAACSAAADALDPVGADARADLTDVAIAAFIESERAADEQA